MPGESIGSSFSPILAQENTEQVNNLIHAANVSKKSKCIIRLPRNHMEISVSEDGHACNFVKRWEVVIVAQTQFRLLE
jgi:hypothetical protein